MGTINNIGIIVGRFQVSNLTLGHKYLIDCVRKNNDRVIVFIGTTTVKASRINPLNFECRKQMLLANYPTLEIYPIPDIGNIPVWNSKLDKKIEDIVNKDNIITLYGSRDSAISTYTGKFSTFFINQKECYSGSDLRKEDSSSIVNSEDFRKGIIYACYDRYPTGYPTIDIVVKKDNEFLFAKKKNRDLYCFVGGFYDPQIDKSLEDTALRELKEETGIIGKNLQWLCSRQIDDYRYTKDIDKIISTLFIVEYESGEAIANDDIEEVRWFSLDEMLKSEFTEKFIIKHHREFFDILIKKLKL